MISTIPNYIEQANILESPVKHAWNDEDPQLFYLGDARLEHRIDKICQQGVVALSAGFAEWIAWRLSKYCNDPVLFYEIEAIWAGIIDWRYIRPLGNSRMAPDRKHWKGAERGPVYAAFYLLVGIVSRTKKGVCPLSESSFLSQLALHVIPDPKPYKNWRRFVIGRLTDMYPCDKDDELVASIPREALDPDFNYKPNMSNELLSAYLQSLNYEKNPFLRSPEEMMHEGFEGTPYVL
jgi:hypothetical protein